MKTKAFLVYLTIPEIRLLLTLLYSNKEEGVYYGNKEQYYTRRNKLIEKLEDKIREA